MRNRALSVVLACAAAVAIVACGGGGGGKTSGAKAINANPTNAKGSVTWCIGKDTTGAFSQAVKSHNAANPNVKAKLIELPTAADQQRDQLITRLRAKSSECDVLGMDVIWTAEFAAQKWLRDVGPIVDKRGSEFIPSTLASAKFEGKYWGIPFNTNAGFLYYRNDKVSSAPTTWQQVDADAQKGGGLVYQGSRYEGLTVNFLERLYSAGGSAVSSDGKKSTINSPQAQKVLTEMVQETKDGAVSKANRTYMEEESRRAFEAGKAALMRNWPYAYALGNQSSIKGKFKVSPLPAFEGGKPAGVLGGYNLGISAYSKNPDAAVEFVNYITNPKSEALMASKASLPPTLKATYDDPAVQKAMPFATELRQAVTQAQPRPVSPVYTQISEAIYNNVYSALTGGSSPTSALKKADSQINSALKTF
jgi:multiple sugar transport system substrate-binding protein